MKVAAFVLGIARGVGYTAVVALWVGILLFSFASLALQKEVAAFNREAEDRAARMRDRVERMEVVVSALAQSIAYDVGLSEANRDRIKKIDAFIEQEVGRDVDALADALDFVSKAHMVDRAKQIDLINARLDAISKALEERP